MKYEECRKHHEPETDGVVPSEFLAEEPYGEKCEHCQSDDFLNRLQLRGAEFVRADAIGRYLKAVFEKRDAPAREHNFPKRLTAILEVAIPGECHEDV